MHRLIAPFLQFIQLEYSGSLLLLIASLVAVMLANSPLAPLYGVLLHSPIAVALGKISFHWTLHEAVNDGLMAIFFLVMGLEIKRELVTGELSSLRRALLPILAALGGVITPALIYLVLNSGKEGAHGWGIPIATDIAFSLAVLSLFGRRIPLGLKVFLVTLAIVDDIVGVLVIATVYTRHLNYGYLFAAILLFAGCLLLNRAGITRLSIYLSAGVLLWWTFHASGVHATLAGVLLAFAIPTTGHGSQESSKAQESPLHRLEAALHPWVSFGIVPLFAFANAGVALKDLNSDAVWDPIFLGIFFGLVFGKAIGITLFSWIAVQLKLAELPHGVSWKQLHAVAWLGGIGFTVSIFIAGLAFETEAQFALVRFAVLIASTAAALVGIFLLTNLSRRSRVPESFEEQVPI
ncbi:Na+/H+ antiporter NhaA [Edaphobacter albus]|uniref:Na+/H+ antiporter NhaA n=1 Tax=Edaphobacter sp. 4G125 TaxID=2763071 RepID=UPI0016444561|nr:Na+/H+ antiporter NhaA [Edaphobacter sp. 4G125]QNI36688.1 Na+/H+ antiporter NhaA [Edaphobacter sp. 4G125]